MTRLIKEFKGEYAFLSNFFPAPIEVTGWYFLTVEHAYMAAKSLDPNDWKKIQQCRHPGTAKKMGRTFKLRPNWDKVKLDVMETLLTHKFSIPYLKENLIATGNAQLQEGNWWGDKYWGVCLKTNQGENHLGRLLMKVREEIQKVPVNCSRCNEFIYNRDPDKDLGPELCVYCEEETHQF